MQGYFIITSKFLSEKIRGLTLMSPLKFYFGLQCKVQSSIVGTMVALESRCNIIIQMVILIKSGVIDGVVTNPLAVDSLCCVEAYTHGDHNKGLQLPTSLLCGIEATFLTTK